MEAVLLRACEAVMFCYHKVHAYMKLFYFINLPTYRILFELLNFCITARAAMAVALLDTFLGERLMLRYLCSAQLVSFKIDCF